MIAKLNHSNCSSDFFPGDFSGVVCLGANSTCLGARNFKYIWCLFPHKITPPPPATSNNNQNKNNDSNDNKWIADKFIYSTMNGREKFPAEFQKFITSWTPIKMSYLVAFSAHAYSNKCPHCAKHIIHTHQHHLLLFSAIVAAAYILLQQFCFCTFQQFAVSLYNKLQQEKWLHMNNFFSLLFFAFAFVTMIMKIN